MRVGAGVLVVAVVAFGHVLPPGHIDNVFSVQEYGAVRCARFTLWLPSLMQCLRGHVRMQAVNCSLNNVDQHGAARN